MINKFGSKKVVIILGAGSTYDNADAIRECEKPPLDRKFFQNTRDFLKNSKFSFVKRREMQYEFEYVKSYFEIWHGRDILSDDEDSLEKVMSQIFSDVKDKTSKERPAFPVFLAFMRLLYDRLGETTNTIGTDTIKPLYQIIAHYIGKGITPENLTILSFNYDIYVERILATLARSFHDPDFQVFWLQHCYQLDLSIFDFTMASHPRIGWFPALLNVKKGGVRVLKLHGSLNWYSVFPSKNTDLESMFKRDRLLKISRESEINSNQLKYSTPDGHLYYTLPVIVPPVQNKSEIYHSEILKLWVFAKSALSEADELLIYGYSCPPLDKDSEKWLKKSIDGNPIIKKISVIDPSPSVYSRYIQIFYPKKIFWYQNSAYFNGHI